MDPIYHLEKKLKQTKNKKNKKSQKNLTVQQKIPSFFLALKIK